MAMKIALVFRKVLVSRFQQVT